MLTKKKNYVHETRNEVQSTLIRINQVKEHPERFKDIRDSEGNPIDPATIKRENELTGAAIEYLICFVDFVCTHLKNYVSNPEGDYYSTPQFEWGAALRIMTGGVSGQNERAEKAIMMYMKKPVMKLCLCSDGHYKGGWPFVVSFDWGTREELEAKGRAIFDGLNTNRGRKQDNGPRLPIQTVTIMFFKPLFEAFFQKNPSTYSFPLGMYAHFYKIASETRKAIENNQTNISSEAAEFAKEADSDTNVIAYTRFARYIVQHNNLTKADLRKTGFLGAVSIPVLEFLKAVYPALVDKNSHGNPRIDWKRFYSFLNQAQDFYRRTPEFLFYPFIRTLPKKAQDSIVIELYKTSDQTFQAQVGSIRSGI
jgi:hypothetical protein